MKFAKLAAFYRHFIADERGHIMLLYIIMLPVTLGFIGLALEGGRFVMLNSELQSLADAAALAGAKELDAEATALTRADTAARTVLNNPTRWSNVSFGGGSEILAGTAGVSFYSKISPGGDTAATGPGDAAYIKVTTVDRSVATSFLRVVGAVSNDTTRASAIAGSTFIACHVQPLMLCNPTETPGGGTPFSATPGQMFVFTPKTAGGSTFAPGDFGLIDPPGQDSSGSNGIRDLLSKTTANFCYINNVSPRPGHATNKVEDGINVRFDLAPNGVGNQVGLDMTPAPNVIKGDSDPKCNKYEPTLFRLPRDTPTTPIAGVEIGTGDLGGTLAKNNYWRQHHNNLDWPLDVGTRWDAYRRELGLNGSAPPWTGESYAPTCNGVAAGDYKRRIIAVAIVNCLEQGVQGNSATDLRSSKYAEFFVTEPATGGAIYTEFVQMITPQSEGATGKLHQVIRLYR